MDKCFSSIGMFSPFYVYSCQKCVCETWNISGNIFPVSLRDWKLLLISLYRLWSPLIHWVALRKRSLSGEFIWFELISCCLFCFHVRWEPWPSKNANTTKSFKHLMSTHALRLAYCFCLLVSSTSLQACRSKKKKTSIIYWYWKLQ